MPNYTYIYYFLYFNIFLQKFIFCKSINLTKKFSFFSLINNSSTHTYRAGSVDEIPFVVVSIGHAVENCSSGLHTYTSALWLSICLGSDSKAGS